MATLPFDRTTVKAGSVPWNASGWSWLWPWRGVLVELDGWMDGWIWGRRKRKRGVLGMLAMMSPFIRYYEPGNVEAARRHQLKC